MDSKSAKALDKALVRLEDEVAKAKGVIAKIRADVKAAYGRKQVAAPKDAAN